MLCWLLAGCYTLTEVLNKKKKEQEGEDGEGQRRFALLVAKNNNMKIWNENGGNEAA